MSDASPTGLPASALQFAARAPERLREQARLLGQGLAFPPRVGGDGRLQWAVGEASITDAIAIILGTSPGERVGLPRFGAGLDRFLFEGNNAGTHARIAAHPTGIDQRWRRCHLARNRRRHDPLAAGCLWNSGRGDRRRSGREGLSHGLAQPAD